MPKNLYYEILDMEKELSDLEKEKRQLEIELSSEKSKKSNAASRSAVGLGVMFQNPAAGYAIKSNGDINYLRSSRAIDELESELTKITRRISDLSSSIRAKRKSWDEGLKVAELVVEGDKLYIKGDPNKNDLLLNVKEIRGKKERQLKDIYEDKTVSAYLKSREEYLKKLEKSGLETFEVYKGRDSKYRAKAESVSYLTGVQLFEELLGYKIPNEYNLSAALGMCNSSIQELEERIERHKKAPELLKPMGMEKIFRKRFQERYQKAKNLSEYHIKDATEKIEEYKIAIGNINDLKDSACGLYTGELKKLEKDFKMARLNLGDEDKTFLISLMQKLQETLETHKCLSDSSDIIYSNIEQYLIDNQLKISMDEFKDKISSMDELSEDIKLEVSVATKGSKEKEHKPKISRNNK